jgi:riboflavin synthase
MFTGIIEALGRIENIEKENSNYLFRISAPFAQELKVDQSVAHNGCCLTVVKVLSACYEVTLVEETLRRTNFKNLQPGHWLNLERSLTLNQRLDGHFVQGHVDQISVLTAIEDCKGSYRLTFALPQEGRLLVVEKGSICINGVSLTVASLEEEAFSVAIIPYTWQHTNLQYLKIGDTVNLEYDILGKYIVQFLKRQKQA